MKIKVTLFVSLIILIIFASSVFAADAHDYFTEILLREESENGTVIANLLENDDVTLAIGKNYYITLRSNTDFATEGGRFKITTGDGEVANSITYVNIPGQTYTPGVIESDAFAELLSFTPISGVKYGTTTSNNNYTTTYDVTDGTLEYSINDSKMNSDIYMAVGFKIDEILWCNVANIENALSLTIGTSSEVEDEFKLNINIEEKKNVYFSPVSSSSEVRAGAETLAMGFSQGTTKSREVIYGEIGFDVTYPEDFPFQDISYSKYNKTSKTSSTYGTISIGEAIDNNDGTYTRKITFGPGRYPSTGISSLFYMWYDADSEIKNGENRVVTYSNGYFIPINQVDSTSFKFSNSKDVYTQTYKVINTDKIIEKVTITPVNKGIDNNMALYNWNIGRTPDKYYDNTYFLSGANIRNTDTMPTYYNKTIKAHYNITNENVLVSFITFPVGLGENGKKLSQVELRYTGFNEDGDEVSDSIIINGTNFKIRTSGNNNYVAIRAIDLGLQGFKSIEADIGKLDADTYTIGWSTYNIYSSNFFGAYGYFTDDSIGTRIECTYEITNTSPDDPINDLKVSAFTESVGNAKGAFQNNFTSGWTKTSSSIVAGNSILIKNPTISMNNVITNSYANTSFIANPVIVLRLPRGMNFSDLSFNKVVKNDFDSSRAKTEALAYTVKNVTYLNETGDGTNLYKITFNDKDLMLGSQVNKYMDNITMTMTIRIGTTKNVVTRVYDLNELINITSERDFTAGSYSSYNATVEDTYGLNNGHPLSGVRKKDASIIGISIQRLDALTIDNAISIKSIDGVPVDESTRTWDTYDSTNQNSISFMGMNTEGEYRLVIENPSTSSAYNFKVIIPIPKEGVNLGEHFTNGANQFNMAITPKDIGDYSSEYIKITSASTEDILYEECAEEEADAILVTKDEVPSLATDTIYFNFVVSNDSSVHGGDFNCWRNYFEYVLDNNSATGWGSYVAAEVATCKIKGTIFEDLVLDGKKYDNEPGLSGVSIVATDSLGRVQHVVPNASGEYVLENVRETDVNIEMESTIEPYVFYGEPVYNDEFIYNTVEHSEDMHTATANVHASEDVIIVNASMVKAYTITYNKGDGKGTAPAKEKHIANSTAIIATPPSSMRIPGGRFVGWSTTKLPTSDNNINLVQYRAGDVITVTEDLTLYAAYSMVDIKVTFDYMGGTPAEEDPIDYKYVRYNQKYGQADVDGKTFPAAPTKENCLFIGWELPNAQYGSGTKVTSSTAVAIDSDTTLRAVWYYLNNNHSDITSDLLVTTTLDEPFLCIEDGIDVINLSNVYDYKFELGSGVTLPLGLEFDTETGTFYGTPLEPFDGVINIIVKAKYSSSAENYYNFDYTVNLELTPNEIEIKNDINPQGTFTLTGESGDHVEIITKVTGLIGDYGLNDSNEITINKIGSDEVVTEIGTVALNASGEALVNWYVSQDDIGTYTIQAVVNNLNSYYTIASNNTIGSYVIAEEVLVLYNVEFNNNGYSFANETKTYVEGTQYGELPSHTIAGYTFNGWFDNTSGDGTPVTTTDTVNASFTLYAVYTQNEYTVNYNTNTDVAIPSRTDVTYEEANLIPSVELTKKGYSLTGWSLAGGSSVITAETKYRDLVSSDSVSEITLNANWRANQYNVTLNPNGGSIGTSSIRVYYDSPYGNLDVPSRVGYDFVNWINMDDEVVTKNSIYNYSGDTTITATWTPKTGYSILFNTNGGSDVPKKENVNWETIALYGVTAPTKEGANFSHWTYNNNEVLATDTFGSLAKNDRYESITLNAVWEVETFTVTLNNGTGYTVENVNNISEVPYDSNYTFKVNIEDGYQKGSDFKVTVNGVTVNLDSNNKYTIIGVRENKEVVVSGVIVEQYEVVFNNNGYNFEGETKTYTRGDSYGELPEPLVYGYIFNGWYENQECTGDAVLSTDIVPSSKTLYAGFTPKSYTVIYDSKIETAVPPKTGVKYDDSNLLPTASLTRLGYTLLGWSLSGDGNYISSNTKYKDLVSSDLVTEISLVAGWEANEYTVIFDTDGGNIIQNKENIYWDDVVLEGIEDPTKEGSDFLYWTYSGDQVADTDKYSDVATDDTISSITLKANWQADAFDIILGSGEGYTIEIVDGTTPVEYDGEVTIKVTIEDGYEKGDDFKVTVNDTEVQLDSDGEYVITGIRQNTEVTVTGVEESTSIVEPSGDVIEPSGDVIEPSGDVIEPSGDVIIEPSGDVIEPSGDVIEPSGDVIEPSGDVVEPSGDVIEPSGDVIEPSGDTKPSGDDKPDEPDKPDKPDKPVKPNTGGSVKISYYKITTSVVGEGTIYPEDARVQSNKSQTFNFTPSDGYYVADVLLDGESIGKVDEYTIKKVKSKHTLEVVFAKEGVWTDTSEWSTIEMAKAYEKGLIPESWKNVNFTKDITRKEFAAIAVKLYEALSGKRAELPEVYPFVDCDDDYVKRAYNVGITIGTSDTEFSPNWLITREQMATMVTRALRAVGVEIEINLNNVNRFIDDIYMNDYGRIPIYFMSNLEIIKGVGDNKFDPQGNATIEQSIAIALRCTEKIAK